jgi:hypothetical protein
MAGTVAPNIVTDDLVLYYDTANTKSYDRSENLALNSEALNLWSNNGNAILRTPNVEIAPNGTLTADTLAQTAATGASRWISSINNRTYTAGVTYTLSIWLKRVSGTDGQPTISLWVNGGMETSIGTITNEWVRYSATFTPGSTISVNTFSGLNTSWGTNGQANNFVFAAWGFQIEVGSSATTYIPTTSTPKLTGTTWIDLSRSGINGTLINGPTFNSANGGSIVFDGVDDYVGITNPTILQNQNFSISVWINPLSPNQAITSIVDYDHGNLQGWVIQSEDAITNRYYYLAYYDGSTFQPSTGIGAGKGVQLTNSIWQNLTYIKNGTSIIGYLNGIQNFTSTAGNANISYQSNRNLRIGGVVFSLERNYKGNIASTQIYNRVLSATEVLQNYNSTKTRFGL